MAVDQVICLLRDDQFGMYVDITLEKTHQSTDTHHSQASEGGMVASHCGMLWPRVFLFRPTKQEAVAEISMIVLSQRSRERSF